MATAHKRKAEYEAAPPSAHQKRTTVSLRLLRVFEGALRCALQYNRDALRAQVFFGPDVARVRAEHGVGQDYVVMLHSRAPKPPATRLRMDFEFVHRRTGERFLSVSHLKGVSKPAAQYTLPSAKLQMLLAAEREAGEQYGVKASVASAAAAEVQPAVEAATAVAEESAQSVAEQAAAAAAARAAPEECAAAEQAVAVAQVVAEAQTAAEAQAATVARAVATAKAAAAHGTEGQRADAFVQMAAAAVAAAKAHTVGVRAVLAACVAEVARASKVARAAEKCFSVEDDVETEFAVLTEVVALDMHTAALAAVASAEVSEAQTHTAFEAWGAAGEGVSCEAWEAAEALAAAAVRDFKAVADKIYDECRTHTAVVKAHALVQASNARPYVDLYAAEQTCSERDAALTAAARKFWAECEKDGIGLVGRS